MDSVPVRLVMFFGVPVVVLVAVSVIALLTYQHRAARAVRTAPGDGWTTTCIDPLRPAALRTLCVGSDSLVLRGRHHEVLAQWQWSQIVNAVRGPVRAFEALVEHQGLILQLADGSSVSLLFPSRSTMRFPAERLDEALRHVNAHLRGPGPSPTNTAEDNP